MDTKIWIWIIWIISAGIALSIAMFGTIFGMGGMQAPGISEKDYFQLKLMVVVISWIIPALQLLSIIPAVITFKRGYNGWTFFILFLPHILFFASFFIIMSI